MAASALFPSEAALPSTSASSPLASSSTKADNTFTKILDFFHSILLFILQTLRRALRSVSRNRHSSSTPHSTSSPSQHHSSVASAAVMASVHVTPNRMLPPKILPALPLVGPRRPSAGKDVKENTAPSSLTKYQPQTQSRKSESAEKLSERLDRLDLGDDLDQDTSGATGAIKSGLPSAAAAGNSGLPGLHACPPLPVAEDLTGEKAIHSGFMREALDMARLALVTNETPVGCVLVHNGRVIAKGMNATNITRNGTRHAELMAISALLSYHAHPQKPAPDAPASEARRRKRAKRRAHAASKNNAGATPDPNLGEEVNWDDVNPEDGHFFPYGQKLHPAPRVPPSIISECVLYVTVEPCVMCASLLRQLRIRKVYFGAVNDKFGGTGGVFRVHMNAGESAPDRATMASAPPSPRLSATEDMGRPSLEPRTMSCNGQVNGDASLNGALNGIKGSDFQIPKRPPTEQAYLGGHGGNVEPGYDAEGGWGRDEAVTLLRQFYVQENGRAPVPRKKEGRAARLALMLERDGHAGGPIIPALPEDEETAPGSPSSMTGDPITSADDTDDATGL